MNIEKLITEAKERLAKDTKWIGNKEGVWIDKESVEAFLEAELRYLHNKLKDE